MKKYLMVLAILILAISAAAFQKQLKEAIISEKPVSKSISFAVYADKTYSSPVYKDATAKLRITVTKVCGTSRTVVWDKIYDARQLRDYPSLKNASTQKVVVNNILDSREQIEVLYTLTYDSKGSKLQMYNGTIVAEGQKEGQLLINI